MKKSKDVLFVTFQLFLFLLYFISPFHVSFEVTGVLKYTGLLLAIVGFVVVVIAILQLNKNLTPFPTPVVHGTLIQNGLYKYIRHPIYSGIILSAIGFGVFNGSYGRVGIGIALWLLFWFKSRYEEEMLCRAYPDYPAYREKTSRFFPFL